jgi:hypothetical protein
MRMKTSAMALEKMFRVTETGPRGASPFAAERLLS